MPEAFDGPALTLEGQRIEVVPAEGLPNRRYLWVPSLQAIFGGVMVFSGLHVWTADTDPGARSAWAHAGPHAGAPACRGGAGPHGRRRTAGRRSAGYTRDYLRHFEREAAKAADSKALIAAMTQLYPQAGSPMSLELGAKVVKGEMQWGDAERVDADRNAAVAAAMTARTARLLRQRVRGSAVQPAALMLRPPDRPPDRLQAAAAPSCSAPA
jgi:hypothetical protein